MRLDRPDLGGWNDLPFWDREFSQVQATLAAETRDILPPADQVFAAMARTPPEDTRVVILGQDPYPTPGVAHGLAFSAAPDAKIPPSLRNIFAEMQDDIGARPATPDLRAWADQGVLLLNTALTVPAGTPGGHGRLGWSALTRDVLMRLSDKPTAFVLWGNHAKSFRAHIQGDGHLIHESGHPSPLSVRHFRGSRPFSTVNRWLDAQGHRPIDWAATA